MCNTCNNYIRKFISLTLSQTRKIIPSFALALPSRMASKVFGNSVRPLCSTTLSHAAEWGANHVFALAKFFPMGEAHIDALAHIVAELGME